MELKDLAGEERIAFVALLKATVMADGNVSDEEREWVEDIADELGEEEYRWALAEVERRFPDADSLRTFLRTVTRPEAREVIYGTLLELALPGAVEGRESELLDWVAREWKVDVRYDPPEGPGGGEDEIG